MEQKILEDTITVDQLIDQLKKYGGNQKVVISGVGVCANDSWNAPLQFGDDTVDEYQGVVRINMSTVG